MPIPLRPQEGEHHGAADQEAIDLRKQVLDDVDLAGDLRSAEHRDEGALRRFEGAAEIGEFLLHQEAGDARLQEVGHPFGRGVGAVRAAEGVVHVEVRGRSEAARELGIVLLLLGDGSGDSRGGARRRRASRATASRDGRAHAVVGEGDRRGRATPRAAPRPDAGSAPDRASLFGRPRWDARIVRAPASIRYRIVGSEARIRVSSATFPSFSGTLKSTRTKTFRPATSTSRTLSLAIPFLPITPIGP